MDITVAVCAKNAEKILGDCLESINNQSLKPDKVLVIDDHSTDATTDIAHRLGARVIVNEGYQLYDGRNTALRHCDTEVLAFTDADCILDEKWVENIIHVFNTRDVVGGTGAHPPVCINGFAGWLHHMWFIVEIESTGYTGGIIGGNSYFKTDALRKVGGWISLPYSAAEDVYIAIKLLDSGYKLWFDENIVAHHKYTNNFINLMKKTVISGEAITFMMKVAGIRNYVWNFTLKIPIVAIMGIVSIFSIFFSPAYGFILIGFVFGGTLFFFWYRFKSLSATIPRFIARWILIWPYAWGVLKGLLKNPT